MAQKHVYPVTLTCPLCKHNHQIETAVIPQQASQVLCHECNHSFEVDILQEVNSERGACRHCDQSFDPEHAFQINKPCCEGFVYDAEGVDRLMRDGVVDAFTEVRPLRSRTYVAARSLQELW